MLRTILIFCAMFMAVGTANAEPLKLTDTQMDTVTAGELNLPNGTSVLDGFDNPAPGADHPNFGRSSKGFDASGGNEGPWSAHFNSSKIGCASCP